MSAPAPSNHPVSPLFYSNEGQGGRFCVPFYGGHRTVPLSHALMGLIITADKLYELPDMGQEIMFALINNIQIPGWGRSV